MNSRIAVAALALLVSASLASGAPKTGAPTASAAKAGVVLGVAALMSKGDQHQGTLRVEGLVKTQ